MSGKITDKRLEVLSSQYEREQAELEQAIAGLEADIDSYNDSKEPDERGRGVLKSHNTGNNDKGIIVRVLSGRISAQAFWRGLAVNTGYL